MSEGRFGLVMGLGVGAGIFYYRSLVQAHADLGLAPELAMVHADVHKVTRLAAAREKQQLADYLAGMLRSLVGAGASMAAITAFAPQICEVELAAQTPLPLVGLLDPLVAEVYRRKLGRVAVLGARVTMETDLFGRLADVDVVPPRSAEVDTVVSLYGRIAMRGSASAEERAVLHDLARRLVERERLDAVLLAGTDLVLVFDEHDTDFPHLDGARLHVEAIMRRIARNSLPAEILH